MRQMRPIQKKSYDCSSNCMSTRVSPTEEDLLKCLQQCGQPVQQAAQVFQGEAQRFQQRLQRCSAGCQDRAQDAMGSGDPNDPALRAKAEKVMGDCLVVCAKEHIGMLPALRKTLEGQLKKLS